MHHQHRQRHHPGKDRERVQQADELRVPRAFVDRVQIVGEMEWHTLDHIANRHAEQQRREWRQRQTAPSPMPSASAGRRAWSGI